MLELLSVSVVRRVPHACEHRPQQLRAKFEEPPTERLVDNGPRRVSAARVVRVAPGHGRVDCEPLPFLERIPDLWREVEPREACIVFDVVRPVRAEKMRVLRTDGIVEARAEERPLVPRDIEAWPVAR